VEVVLWNLLATSTGGKFWGRWRARRWHRLSRRAQQRAIKGADMIYRTFGRTGIKVSAVGLEGSHVGSPADENDGIRIVRTAIDRGITFMDNCWDYYGGKIEVVLGKALRDRYREKVFLMSKFDRRTIESVA
jgi:hypothetical protein